MNIVWALLLALVASWGLGLGLARLIDKGSNMLPAITILIFMGLFAASVVVPWASTLIRLRLMQVMALASVVIMVMLA